MNQIKDKYQHRMKSGAGKFIRRQHNKKIRQWPVDCEVGPLANRYNGWCS